MGLFTTTPAEKHGPDLLDRLPLGISIYRLEDARDPRSFRIVYGNAASGDITGLNVTRETGRRLVDVVPNIGETGLLEVYAEIVRTQEGRDLGTVTYGDDRIEEATYGIRAIPLADRCVAIVFEDVSDRSEVRELHDARADLEREEARYRSLVESSAAIVWTTPPSGELQTDQVQWQAVTGQTPEESAGAGWLDAIHPDDRAHTMAAWQAAVATRDPYRTEHRLRQADGSYRRMAVRGTPVVGDDGAVVEWVGTHTDVEEPAAAAAELAASEARFRTLFDAIGDVLLVYPLGADGPEPLVAFNQAAVERYGYSADELRAMTVTDLVAPGRIDVEASLDELRRTRKATFDSTHVTRDGTRLPMATSARLVEYDGRLCVVALCRDDSDRRAFRREIARTNRTLEAAVEDRTRQLEAFSDDLKILHGITTAEHESHQARVDAYLRAGCEMFEMPVGILSATPLDPETGDRLYRLDAVVSPDPALTPGLTVPIGEAFCDAVLEQRRTVSYADANDEAPEHPACAGRGLRAFIGTPVWVDGEIEGTLNFVSPEPRPAGFSESESDLIEVMAQAIGRRMEADRAEADRAETRKRYRTIVETVDAGVIVVDTRLRVVMSNPSARELLGMEDRDLDGDRQTDEMPQRWPVVDADGRPVPEGDLPERVALATGEPVRGAIQGIVPPGEPVRWYRVNATPVDHDRDGVPDAVVVSFHDVTDLRELVSEADRTRTEAERTRSMLESVLAASPDGVMAFESVRDGAGAIADFEWTLATPLSAAIVGKTSDELVGRRLLDVFPGNVEAGLFDAYVGVVETRAPFETTVPYQADGLQMVFRVRAVALPDADGFTVLFTDVSGDAGPFTTADVQAASRRPRQRHVSRPALLVFAKVPEPGRVKTRLCPPLTPAQAAGLYDALLRDALDRYAALAAAPGGPAVRLHLAGAAVVPPGLVPAGVEVLPQRGDGLGDRMLRAFVAAFAAGYDRAVVVGTDHPTLPTAFFGLAFDALADPMTAVLGPSEDGGYYLLGLNDVAPDLFDMAYSSHPAVFRDTLDRVMELDMTPVVLPEHYDVDDGPALARLAAEWRGGADVGVRTSAMLRTLTEGGLTLA